MDFQANSHLGIAASREAARTDRSVLGAVRDIYQMMKPTIGMLVVITAIPSLLMAGARFPDPMVALVTLIGTFLASSSAGVFNHLVDSDIDGHMNRTRLRPLPGGRISRQKAALAGLALGVISFAMLYRFTTPLAAWISLAANVFYVVGYTMYLKRRTVQNIVIGGAAGAVGPLIGWAAVDGSLAWPAWVLFLIIFLWTPPHFWSLAIKYKDDYARAKIPMLPSVLGVDVTKRQIFWYTLSLIPPVVFLFTWQSAGWWYFVPSLALTIYFLWLAVDLLRSRETLAKAMPLFFFSCLYLFGIFGFLTIDRIIAYF